MLQTTRYTPLGFDPFILQGLAEDNTVFGPIANTGVWEPHLVAALQRIVRPEFVCLDIGANIGAITLVLARLAHRGGHAFEASAVSARLLRSNVEQNGLQNVAVAEKAISSKSGEYLKLYTVPGQLGTAHLSLHDGKDGDIQTVETVALDDYPIPHVDFIKLDIEGAEIAALQGARGLLERDRPILAVEYNPAPAPWFAGHCKRDLYDVLTSLYGSISIVEQDGTLRPVGAWEELDARLTDGVWCDLICSVHRR